MIKAPTPQEIEEAGRPFEGTFYDGPNDPVRAYSKKYLEAQDAEVAAAGGLQAWRKKHRQTRTPSKPKPATV